jgi:opacity protein-like surface antigen
VILGSLALVCALAAGPAAAAPAATPPADDHRWEVTLDVGASLLSVEDEGRPLVSDDIPALSEVLPVAPVRAVLPGNLRVQTRIGGSMLQGFDASRRVGSRGWIETGLQLAPMHTRRRSVSFVCPAEVCALLGIPNLTEALSNEDRVTAYHYGLGFAYELTRGEVRPFLSAGIGAVTYDIPDDTNTDLAFDVGAGVRLGFSEHVGARLEVLDRIVIDHFLSGQTEHDVHVRAGVTFRLP